MKTKIVLWGKDSNDTKSLIALQLHPEESLIDVWVFPEPLATEELGNQLLFDWREEKKDQAPATDAEGQATESQPFEFPEGGQKFQTHLSVTESILPEGITADKPDLIQRAQTEWQFIVLSAKLNEAYQNELDDIEENVNQLEKYSSKAWGEVKTFWEKVNEQIRERNLSRPHADAIRSRTNTLFSKLKQMRATMDAAFKAEAEDNYLNLLDKLNDIDQRVAKNLNLYNIFEELKSIQTESKKLKLTRDQRNEVWKRVDVAFKVVKEKRFGSSNPVDRVARRYDGLMNAIKKMENSIGRDRDDLDFQEKRIKSVNSGQLEMQIRQAKIKMIEERVSSKQTKLNEMYKTKIELEDKMEKAKARQEAEEEKRRQKEAARKAKQEAKEAGKKANTGGEDVNTADLTNVEVPETSETPEASEKSEMPAADAKDEIAAAVETETPATPATPTEDENTNDTEEKA